MNDNLITLPLIPLRGITIFPSMIIHFDVAREKSITALESAMEKDVEVFLVTQKKIKDEVPKLKDLYTIGTVCKIKQLLKLPNDVIRVLVEGIERAKLIEITGNEKYIEANIENLEELENKEYEGVEAYIRTLKKCFAKYIKMSENEKSNILKIFEEIKDYDEIVDVISAYMLVEDEKKQGVLEELNLIKRIEKLIIIINNEIEIVKVEKRIDKKLKNSMDKVQKEYYLREQIKIIQEELGEDNDEKKEIIKYEERIKKAKLPKNVKEKALYEISRLKASEGQGSEGNVIRSYLDWILDLPWGTKTKDTFEITKASKYLDEEHYGLEEVKERIIEYLAVKKHTNSLKGPILCLVGPPGVGKSSIAKSVANALGRNFVRISLGGLRDEAEIRGHRKTYVGAIPGRIIYAMKEAKSNNPLILLDEIDKLNSDQRGNPADALLEVLDSEQNKEFRDNYLELDFNLSEVLFITTANSTDTIPGPLYDRMEIIEVSGYTYEEKFHIAKKHIIPKVLKNHNLTSENIKISDSIINEVINCYTIESGVRGLERVIGKLIRKSLTEMLKTNKESLIISKGKLEKLLGPKPYTYDKIDKEDRVGVVNGMAWTAYGGTTLPIEVAVMKGTGKLEITGQLGEVMQESAKIAVGYVRSNSNKYGLEADFYKNTDIYIHAPEGSIKKDGPSAGVAMVTAIVSALSNKKIRRNIAMTGEVTLTGKVLAIGGLKEKSIAAQRSGVDTIIVPKQNEKDIIKIPNSIKNKLKIILVEDVKEVLNNALIGVDTIEN
ncbi:endopeptidase La [Clostridium gasigenes]|uniref:Lon protease n=1 Tax=Clostridium gasigenes TaxID=94869 RepID=A0A1H0S7W2_9CLOT|nr:endopeptidase La [Clostridium gasigenes]MBB6622772.1 endopeptidase La [Clostridium gasigenes]MBU3089471.1 endopeptidase La [Clostridium gasigenes]MBU3103702.1 endopeptidase La [Clostridium gasigenes]MBU3108349.1 endopeptidase La [Clostridium gasigenes]MBU3132958.1 endopeptidase La [Clostridium gasigenes]